MAGEQFGEPVGGERAERKNGVSTDRDAQVVHGPVRTRRELAIRRGLE